MLPFRSRVWAMLERDVDDGTLRLKITQSTGRRPVEEHVLVIDLDGQRAIGFTRLAQNIGGYLLDALPRQ